MLPQRPAYAAAHFGLQLDGSEDVGLVKSIEGGGVKTDLIKYQNGASHPTFLRVGRPKYEDIKVQVGMSMSKALYDWMEAFFAGNAMRKSGSIIAADFNMCARARRDFAEAMITELQFPKLDGNDKNACYMAVTISPETMDYKPGGGEKLKFDYRSRPQKLWAACNFDMVIDQFGADATKRVTKIDAFTIKQKPIEYAVGGLRAAAKMPGRVEYPNLVFYMPEADAQPFIDHHKKYVIDGTTQIETRLTGAIHIYDHRGGTPIFEVKFAGGEIFNIAHDKSDAASEEIKQVKLEMGIEKLEFVYPMQWIED